MVVQFASKDLTLIWFLFFLGNIYLISNLSDSVSNLRIETVTYVYNGSCFFENCKSLDDWVRHSFSITTNFKVGEGTAIENEILIKTKLFFSFFVGNYRWVCAPQYLSFSTSMGPKVSVSTRTSFYNKEKEWITISVVTFHSYFGTHLKDLSFPRGRMKRKYAIWILETMI